MFRIKCVEKSKRTFYIQKSYYDIVPCVR